MVKTTLLALSLCFATLGHGAEPTIDNDRVTVWNTSAPMPPAEHDLENDRVAVWSYRWNPGEPTPMHFHDKDAVVVFEDDGVLKSTTSDGKSVISSNKSGDVRFSPRERTHTEVLVSGAGSAVITELK